MGNICYLAGEYQDPNEGDEVFLPLNTTRHYNFTEPTTNEPPVGQGEFFAWQSGFWAIPIEDSDYKTQDQWTTFYFNNEPDADSEPAPNWSNILRSVQRREGDTREYTTITTTDDTGKTFIYRVMTVTDSGDYVMATVEYVSSSDVTNDDTINNILEKRKKIMFTTPPALPGDEVISNP